jgi:heterodisulfide reductase subunit C
MDVIRPTAGTGRDFADEVLTETSQEIALCYQCGNCTAGCPYTEFFDYPVNQIMRLIQMGMRETVMSSRSIWLCATCETCTTRCPCEIDVACIMDYLRATAFRERRYTEKEIKIFYEAFLSSLKSHGRIFEPGVLMHYNLISGHLLTDADLGTKVVRKGLVRFLPRTIKGKQEVAKVFSKFAAKRAK